MRLTLRSALVLAVLVLLAGATPSYAQFAAGSQVTFGAAAANPQVRAQGITEASGDIVLTTSPLTAAISVGAAPAVTSTAQLSVTYNGTITNAATTPTTITMVGVLVPGPGAIPAANGTTFGCGPTGTNVISGGALPGTVTGIGIGGGAPSSVVLGGNGISVTFTSLTCTGGLSTIGWNVSGNTLNITYTVPTGATLTFNVLGAAPVHAAQIHGVRTNASGATGAVTATVTSSPVGIVFLSGFFNPLTVATIVPGLDSATGIQTDTSKANPNPPNLNQSNKAVTINTVTSFTQCGIGKKTDATIGISDSGSAVNVVVKEGFVGAFTTAAQETGKSGTEVTNGTRIQLQFPAGLSSQVNVYVPQAIGNVNLTLALVSGTVPICGPVAAANACTLVSVAGSSTNSNTLQQFPSAGPTNTLTIEYEVVTSAPSGGSPSAIQIPVFIQNNGSLPDLNTVSVAVQLSPVSTTTTQSSNTSSNPIVRFITLPVSGGTFKINACITGLIFPFVSSKSGFDTGISISNTGQDDKATSSQSGVCVVSFWDGTNPAPSKTPTFTVTLGSTTSPILAGQTATTLLSAVAPVTATTTGFQGYAIAKCGFQFAHGFAVFTNQFGGASLGQPITAGYLAIVTPDSRGTSGGIETLGN